VGEKNGFFKGAGCLLIIGVFFAIGLIGNLLPGKKSVATPSHLTSSVPDVPTNSITSNYIPMPGDSIELRFGVKSTYLGRTKQDVSELLKYVAAKDELGAMALMKIGRVFVVPNGTMARYIETVGFGVAEVRILDGEYYGNSGYVVKEACIKIKNNSQ
jgi:hypothetical protein